MSTRTAVSIAAAILMLPSPSAAQTNAAPRSAAVSPATPSPPHERLSFFEGTWTVAELPAERAFRERCAWLESGRRHMICRSRSRNAAGEIRETMSMFSYRPADSTYLYYGLSPSGAVEQLTGRATADGWEFSSESGSGETRDRKRVTITRLTEGRFRFIEATARGDAPFAGGDSIHYVPAPAER